MHALSATCMHNCSLPMTKPLVVEPGALLMGAARWVFSLAELFDLFHHINEARQRRLHASAYPAQRERRGVGHIFNVQHRQIVRKHKAFASYDQANANAYRN